MAERAPEQMVTDLALLRGRLPGRLMSDQEFCRAGKKAAGRLLDGVEHSAFPEMRA